MKKQYEKNKNKKRGEECICPSCKSIFNKESYNQIFCKSRSGTKCKDRFWNTVTPTKRNNTTRISPASRRFLQKRNNLEDNHRWLYDGDQGWDAHK